MEELIGYLKLFAPLIIFFGLMYLLIVRPQTKQQQKRKEMLDNLKVGDKIRTIGGFYGTIERIKEDDITVKLADKVIVEMAKFSVESVLDK
ncbi:MAG: preprotein translocase subunit YajC [Bacillota bacterium]|mgnify:CR=1 FL=1|jgi:preprotein translocase subunit YajC|nr:preprotein translocase subunit YajC [Bacillota bacterium]HHU29562.1 preprotein translocase subunit YajC [Bacillota bacterium]